MTFASKHYQQIAKPPLLLRTSFSEKESAWCFVQAKPFLEEVLRRKVQAGGVDLTAYSKILASGWGDNPPKEIIDQMHLEYGFVEST